MRGPDSKPSWRLVPFLPWLGLFGPGRAARLMACAPWPVFLATHFFHIFIWASTIVFLTLWEDSQRYYWRAASGPAIPAGEILTRSLGEVWADWHRHGPLGDAEAILGALLMAGFVGTAVLAWLFLPTVHAGGRVAANYARAYRGIGCIWGPVLVATVLLGAGLVSFKHLILQAQAGVGPSQDVFGFLLFLSFLVAAHLLAFWLERAMHGVGQLSPRVELPPMCEGCGYNLTHVPHEGRCPECGMEAAASLTPGVRRRGWAWEHAQKAGRLAAWFEVNRILLFQPKTFYERLSARSHSPAPERFVRWHMWLMGGLTALWIPMMLLADQPGISLSIKERMPATTLALMLAWLGICATGVLTRALVVALTLVAALALGAGALFLKSDSVPGWPWNQDGFYGLPFMALMGVSGLGWLIHRLAGAVAASWWFLRGELADPRGARKVLAYESIFLWVFWLYGLALSGSFMVYGDWLAKLVGRQWIAGFPLDLLIVMGGMAALLAVWVRRYLIAGRAVRWANF